MTLKQRVFDLHYGHPDWCPQQIAIAIGRPGVIGAAYVRATAQKAGIKLPRSPQGPTPASLHRAPAAQNEEGE